MICPLLLIPSGPPWLHKGLSMTDFVCQRLCDVAQSLCRRHLIFFTFVYLSIQIIYLFHTWTHVPNNFTYNDMFLSCPVSPRQRIFASQVLFVLNPGQHDRSGAHFQLEDRICRLPVLPCGCIAGCCSKVNRFALIKTYGSYTMRAFSILLFVMIFLCNKYLRINKLDFWFDCFKLKKGRGNLFNGLLIQAVRL